MTAADARTAPTISPLRGQQKWLFLLGLLLLWPALLQGDAYGFNDTVSYLRGADAVFAKLTGHHATFFAPPPDAAASVAAGPGDTMVLYGRSLYFGLYLYLGLLLGSFWVPVVLQALAAGAVIVGVMRHFVDPVRKAAFAKACLAASGLAACTPLPFFVCFLMPDVWVALALLAAVLLLCGWSRERPAWRAGLLALIAFAALSHSTTVAVLLLLGVAGLAAAALGRARAVAAVAILAMALVGVAGEAAFGLATRLTTGAAPVRPPFLTARLIEDGPARRYLAEHCGSAAFVLCRYRIDGEVNAEIFLWETSRPRGGFKALPTADAIRVSQEQTRFALAVLQAYPAQTATALAGDLARLAGTLRLHDFRPEYRAGLLDADRAYEAMPPGMPLPLVNRIVSVATWLLVLASLAALPWITRRAGQGRAMVLTMLGTIVLNDMICAWLSGPFARYHTRVIWTLPLLVLLWALASRVQRRASTQIGCKT